MKFQSMTSMIIASLTLALCMEPASAVQVRDVKCANGRTVQASDAETDAMACLTIGSQPGQLPDKAPALRIGSANANDTFKAAEYRRLARQHRPRTAEEERLVKEFMALPAVKRKGFEANHPDVSRSIWDYGPYAVCFYASVAGGADVVEAGDECHDKWVD